MRLKLVPALVALACTPPALLAQVTDSMILNDARSVGDVLSWGLGTEGQRYRRSSR
jgi:alcohol dehydrogenase (cytochrome c)